MSPLRGYEPPASKATDRAPSMLRRSVSPPLLSTALGHAQQPEQAHTGHRHRRWLGNVHNDGQVERAICAATKAVGYQNCDSPGLLDIGRVLNYAALTRD